MNTSVEALTTTKIMNIIYQPSKFWATTDLFLIIMDLFAFSGFFCKWNPIYFFFSTSFTLHQ